MQKLGHYGASTVMNHFIETLVEELETSIEFVEEAIIKVRELRKDLFSRDGG